jgi:hypothetical protein
MTFFCLDDLERLGLMGAAGPLVIPSALRGRPVSPRRM